jgi:hypothetical protein
MHRLKITIFTQKATMSIVKVKKSSVKELLGERRRGATACEVNPRLRFKTESEYCESERVVCERD